MKRDTKTFEIEINNNLVAFGDIRLCLGYRLMGGRRGRKP